MSHSQLTPKVYGYVTNERLDDYLLMNLDKDGILRIKAAEMATQFMLSSEIPNPEVVDKILNKYYNFLKNEQQSKQLH